MSERHSRTAMVIGGGVAGMNAAVMLARRGHKVHLVEREPVLGGLVSRHGVAAPGHEPPSRLLADLMAMVETEEGITVHTSSKVTEVTGEVLRFKVAVQDGDGEVSHLDVGAIVIATGARPFDPTILSELRYGRSPSIITTVQLEGLLKDGGAPTHPGTRRLLKRVAFVQCVGSRMETRGNPWCSNVCCVVTLKQSLTLKERDPGVEVLVYYMDIRAIGRGQEEMYTAAKLKGVRFSRGIPSEVIPRKDGTVLVRAEDASLGKVIERDHDLLVLSVGLEPAEGTDELVKVLGLAPSKDGFVPIANPEVRPCCTGVKGIVVAGAAEFPKGIKDAVLQGRSAALMADMFLTERWP